MEVFRLVVSNPFNACARFPVSFCVHSVLQGQNLTRHSVSEAIIEEIGTFFFKFDGAFTAAMQEKQMVFVRMRQLISNFFGQTT